MRRKRRSSALRILWWCSFAVFIVSAFLIALYLFRSASNKHELEEITAFVMGVQDNALPAQTAAEAFPNLLSDSVDGLPTMPLAPTQTGDFFETAEPPAPSVLATSTSVSPSPAPTASQTPAPTQTPLSAENAARLERYRALAAKNPDFIGWLNIANTRINEPVMHTPSWPQYYLYRNFKGAASSAGLLFLDANCVTEDAPANKIIYGHRMQDGSRFSDLKLYLDEAFFKSQPYIQFDTLHGLGKYQAIAAIKIHVGPPDDPAMFCYRQLDTKDQAVIDALCAYLDQYALVRADGVNPQWGDELLTLSTCGRPGQSERVIVIARRVLDAQ